MTLRKAAIAVTFALSAAACGQATDAPAGSDSQGDIKVTASTAVWGSVATAIGRDEVQVTSLAGDSNGDPHDAETKPSDFAAVRDAQLLIYNGGGYDDPFVSLLANAGKQSHAIEAVGVRNALSQPSAQSQSSNSVDSNENEHVWYDLGTVRAMAQRISAELIQLAPDKKSTFDANYAEFTAKLDELNQKIAEVGAGKKVAETESVAHYLLRSTRVEVITPKAFSQAIEEETDVSAGALASMIDLVENRKIDALINNTQTENAATRQIVEKANAVGIPVVQVTESLPQGQSDYLGWMTAQVDSLVGALKA